MTYDPLLLGRLADVLSYPGADFAPRVAQCVEALAARHPAAAARLARFQSYALASGAGALEEAYTQAFDVAPVASPYVGDQLFGATRERSYLLSGLRELRREAGLAPGAELADHVAEVIRLVAAPIPEDVREDLVRDGLAPVLARMRAALDEARHPWADVLAAAVDVFEAGAEVRSARALEALP